MIMPVNGWNSTGREPGVAGLVDGCVSSPEVADGRQVSCWRGCRAAFTYHRNHLYSVAAITDENGAVVRRYAYGAYGQQEVVVDNAPAGLEQAYGLTGRRLDGETGLWYFRARYYDDAIGRFVTRDPLGYLGKYFSAYKAYFVPWSVDPMGMLPNSDDTLPRPPMPEPRPQLWPFPAPPYDGNPRNCIETALGLECGIGGRPEDVLGLIKDAGYVKSDSCDMECGKKKIAVYGEWIDGGPVEDPIPWIRHLAYQDCECGWLSKFGPHKGSDDHALKELIPNYGDILYCAEVESRDCNCCCLIS